MILKINSKQYQRNDKEKTNIVYFSVDDIDLKFNIVYLVMNGKRFNAFLDDSLYSNVKKVFTEKYPNINFEDFKKYFMYKLYKYSKGVGLDKECLNITPEIIKNIEEA